MSLWAALNASRRAVTFVALFGVAAFFAGFFTPHGHPASHQPSHRSAPIAQHHSHHDADATCATDTRDGNRQHGHASDHWHDDTRPADAAVQHVRPWPCGQPPHLSARVIRGPVFRVDRPPTRRFSL